MATKIIANDIKMGNCLLHKGKLYLVSKNPEHTTYGRAGAYIQLEMRDIKTNIKTYERLRSTETVDKADLYQEEYQFLYRTGNIITVMHNETYDQTEVDASIFGEAEKFLVDGMKVKIDTYNNEAIVGFLPETVVCTVEEADPVIKGQTVSASFKPAVLDNGVRVMVPPFVKTGDVVVVRTADSSYVERFKN